MPVIPSHTNLKAKVNGWRTPRVDDSAALLLSRKSQLGFATSAAKLEPIPTRTVVASAVQSLIFIDL
ncbi:hypothetical protein CGI16_22825 [Vibrio parahaemolyticus]|nr:hypothetical protein [Vibrio cholerae]TOK33142.1 hypothetical protein CGI19_19380 [Vibrio parahaemolyticus]TOK52036.1 hypothetical protein CGI16_22825 [Vibrio parahaemolyticus]